MKETQLRDLISEEIKFLLAERFGSKRLQSLVSSMSKWEKSAFLKAGVNTGLDWNTLTDADLKVIKKTPSQLYGKQGIFLIIASQDFDFHEGGSYGWKRTIKKGQMIGMMIGGKVAYITRDGLGSKSKRSSGGKVGMDMAGARSVKGMSEMPHIAFEIDNSDKMQALKSKQATRVNLKFGATAIKSAKEFKQENLDRYKKALMLTADKSEKIHKLVLAAVNHSNALVQKALAEMQTDGSSELAVDINGTLVKLQAVTRLQNTILDNYNRYTRYDQDAKTSMDHNGTDSYYQKARGAEALALTDNVKNMLKNKFDRW